MALKVGELFATMRLDSDQFDRGLGQTERRLGGLQRAIGAGAKAAAGMFAGAVTGAAALTASALKVGVGYNSLRQTAVAALTTLTGSAEGAADQMDRLDEFGRTSWVMRDVLVQAQTQMMGFGVETEKVIPYLDALQEGVAAVGGSNQDYAELARLMAQIEGQSKITAEELNQFGIRGIDAAGLIGEAMGKTGGEIREEITAGSLDATEALDALAESMSTKFEGATENVRDTWDGAVANMQGAWRDFGAALAEPLVDPTGGGYLVTWANDVANALWDLEAKARPLVDLLVERFTPGLESVSPALQSVADSINAWDLSKVNGQLDELSKYTPLIAGAGAALFAFGAGNIPILGSLIGTINPVVAGLAAMAATSPEIRAAGGEVLRSLEPLLPVLSSLGVDVADLGVQILRELVPALGDLLASGGEAAVALTASLAPAVIGLVEAGTPLVSMLADVVGWVSDLPTPVLAAGLAFVALQTPLTGVITTLTGAARGAFTGFTETMAASRATADLLGRNVGIVGTTAIAARSGVTALGTAMKTAFLSNPIGLAIAGITTAVSLFATKSAEAKAGAQEFRATLDELGRTTEDTARMIVDNFTADTFSFFDDMRLSGQSVAEVMDRLGISAQDATGYILGEQDAIERVDAAMQAHLDTAGFWNEQLGSNQGEVNVLREYLNGQRSEVEYATGAQEYLNDALGTGAESTSNAATESADYADQLLAQRDAQDEAADSALSLADAQGRQEDQVDRTHDAIQKYKDMVDSGEASERELEAALRDAESQLRSNVHRYNDTTDAMRRNNRSGMELRETTQANREEFIRQARQLGYTAQEARDLADEYGLIPDSIETIIRAETANAQRAVNSFIETNDGRTIYVRVEGRQVSYGTSSQSGSATGPYRYEAQGDVLSYFAEGGMSPMAATLARIVPANTKRVIGDRASGDEAFIPLVPGNQRSVALWEEAGRRLGTLTAYMADGGLTSSQPVPLAAPAQQPPIHIEIHSVPTDHVSETAKALNFALRSRSRGHGVGVR